MKKVDDPCYEPILAMLIVGLQRGWGFDDFFYLYFRQADRLLCRRDLDDYTPPEGCVFTEIDGVGFLRWTYAPDARRAAWLWYTKYKTLGLEPQPIDMLHIRRHKAGLGHLMTEPMLVHVENVTCGPDSHHDQ
jgi:hypothetical protein